MIGKAKKLAYKMHNNPSVAQRYGDAPYTKHLEDVVSVIKRYLYYIPEDKHDLLISAGYLHDIIEDTEISEKFLIKHFSYELADIIYRVSNERARDGKEKLFKTLPKIWRNEYAIFLKLADRIANTQNSKNSGHRVYEKYKREYYIFKYALKIEDMYVDMWGELDSLNI